MGSDSLLATEFKINHASPTHFLKHRASKKATGTKAANFLLLACRRKVAHLLPRLFRFCAPPVDSSRSNRGKTGEERKEKVRMREKNINLRNIFIEDPLGA